MLKMRTLLFVTTLVVFFSACKEKSVFPGYEVSDDGLNYKFYKKSDSDKKPKTDDYVTVTLVRKINDTIIWDSRKNGDPKNGTVEYQLGKPLYPSSIEGGIAMMSIGDSASFMVYTDSLIKHMPQQNGQPNQMKKGVVIQFDIKIVSIRNKAVVEQEMKAKQEAMQKAYEDYLQASQVKIKQNKESEPKLIAEYIKNNKIMARPDKNGMYFVEKQKGAGPKIKVGDKVTVVYKGMFLDGEEFDGSDRHEGQPPFEFTIGKKEVIDGWDLGFQMMSKGAKATLILPSKLGYDTIGMQDQRTGRYNIYPYTPLVFDVEVVDVK